MREKERQLSTPQMPNPMSDERQRIMLQADRDDLLAVLSLRFGTVPESIQARITVCNNSATLERWILVAANVPDWTAFLKDLDAGPNAFKMVGAGYEPNIIESGVTDVSRRAPAPQASDEARKED